MKSKRTRGEREMKDAVSDEKGIQHFCRKTPKEETQKCRRNY